MAQITAKPKQGEKFGKGVSWLKARGFKFDAGSKTWALKWANYEEWLTKVAESEGCTQAQYLSRNGVEILSTVKPAPMNAASTYVGQASMDAEESIF